MKSLSVEQLLECDASYDTAEGNADCGEVRRAVRVVAKPCGCPTLGVFLTLVPFPLSTRPQFGGWPYLALQYVIDAGGLRSDADMPYCAGVPFGREGNCLPCMPDGYSQALCGDYDGDGGKRGGEARAASGGACA